MPNPTASNPTNPRMTRVHTFGHPNAPAPRTGWAPQARMKASTPGVSSAAALLPFPPTGLALAQGSGSALTATWTAPTADTNHGAATGYNIRFGLAGSGNWTTSALVASPYTLGSLAAETAYDVQVQSIAAAGVSMWSTTATLTTAAVGPFSPGAPTVASAAPPPESPSAPPDACRRCRDRPPPPPNRSSRRETARGCRSPPAGCARRRPGKTS